MKKFFILIISCLLYQLSAAQTSGTITDINNQTITLNNLNGKKVLVMILPVHQDTAVINELVQFKNKFGDTVTVVGLVCLTSCNVTAGTIAGIYEDAIEAGVIISVGSTFTELASEREVMLKWLSDKSANSRQIETGITGSKYFLSKQGKMYAHLPASASLGSRIAESLVRTKVPGETN